MDMEEQHSMFFDCDGTPLPNYQGGSWIGHILPGVVFLIWGTHWMLASYRSYLRAAHRQRPFVSQPFYRGTWLPKRVLVFVPSEQAGSKLPSIEMVLKVIGPLFGILAEMLLAHKMDFRTLYCPQGTKRHDQFFGTHMTNWQHASIYPGFILSGLIDILSLFMDLPRGAQHASITFAFFVKALLMGLHKKHFALDAAVHELLGYSMAAVVVFLVLEAYSPHSFLLTAGRVFAVHVEAAWFFAASAVLFEHRPEWSDPADMAPVMFVPVLYALILLMVATYMIIVFIIMALFLGTRPSSSGSPSSPSSAASEDDEEMEAEQVKLLPGSPDAHHDLEHGVFSQAARKHRELGMVALY